MPLPTQSFTVAADALAAHGWYLLEHLLTAAQTRALAAECLALHEAHAMVPAATGLLRTTSALRGDVTAWFAPEALSAAQQVFVERLDALRVVLSRDLLLGLIESEAHYAVYPPGAGYARHLDRLRGSDARVVSAVFYLNPAWQDAEGGALRLYLPSGGHRDIYPHGGSLVLFLSGQFEHEVLPAKRQRLSIACWMRQRTLPLS